MNIHCRITCGQYPIQIMCDKLSNLKYAMTRILNMYVKNNLSLEFYDNRYDTPMHKIVFAVCRYIILSAIVVLI